MHLITSLPIIISNIIKKDTRYILRISGLPKYNFLRKYIWKNLGKNIFKVTCPTKGTMEDLKLLKIFDEKKLFLLKDPIIKISEILKKRREKINQIFTDKDYKMISIGRLTTQKNFKLIVNFFEEFLKINQNCKLIIIGDGEQKFFLNNLIKKKNLNEKIFLLGFKKNIFSYLSKADLFILPSLWEDPGWVLIEAGACGTLILSSDCKNGPSEFIHKDNGGLLFENNSSDDLIKKFKQINDLDNNQLLYKKIFAKKNAKEFTIFKHYNNLTKILN